MCANPRLPRFYLRNNTIFLHNILLVYVIPGFRIEVHRQQVAEWNNFIYQPNESLWSTYHSSFEYLSASFKIDPYSQQFYPPAKWINITIIIHETIISISQSYQTNQFNSTTKRNDIINQWNTSVWNFRIITKVKMMLSKKWEITFERIHSKESAS